MALKRALRLRKNSDFQRVRQQGRSITSRLLILAWMPTSEPGVRVGFVVSKRISKQAVIRNHSKRLLSEAIRPSLDELSGGWDVVISARYQILDADLYAITHDITTLLRRARLLSSLEPSS
ncbi:MAG: ribonuclease P protein component [Ktedonobacteraceae bacterium]